MALTVLLKRFRIQKADLVLARAAFVVAVFGVQAHLLDGKADLTAQVLALVQRRDIKVAAAIQRRVGGAAVLIGLEQVKFALAADVADQPAGFGALYHRLQIPAAVALKRAAVGQGDVAVHAHNAALGGAPRQHGGGVGVGVQHQVAFLHVQKPCNGGTVKADALLKGAGQLAGKK